jgi:cytochrome c1
MRRSIPIIGAIVLVMATCGVTVGAWYVSMQDDVEIARALTGGDPAAAPALLRRYGCGGCHTIPGIAGADGKVAPPLAGLRQRVYIAGVIRNTPDNLMAWIVAPQALSPRSAMPATGITAAEARDVAAYLYAQ